MSDHPEPVDHADGTDQRSALSRRLFLGSGAATTATLGMLGRAEAKDKSKPAPPPPRGTPIALAPTAHQTIRLEVNGSRRTLTVEPRTTLVEALRDTLGLTGTKIGCNHGQCGACTVLLDGRRVNSCLQLAVSADGAKVVTIEGLAGKNGEAHPMQKAFAEHDAFQCGYCTPGQIMSAIACIDEGHAGSADEIREYMSGNLCRCAAYPKIVAAIASVRDGKKG